MATIAADVSGLSPSFSAATNTLALYRILAAYMANPDAATNYLTATSGGLVLQLETGIYQFDASAFLVMGPGLTIKGRGPLQTTIRYTEDGAALTIGVYRNASNHHTGGGVEDLTFDGNGVAKTLLECRLVNKIRVSNVAFINAANGTADENAALVLMGTQNSLFDHLLITDAGGTGTLLNYGAAGNTFVNQHMSGCFEELRLSGTHPYLDVNGEPKTNHWINPIFERDNSAHTKTQTIYIGAGTDNVWDHGNFEFARDAAKVELSRTVAIVKMERQEVTAAPGTYQSLSNNVFRDCIFGGSLDSYATDLSGSGGYGANHYKWTRAFDVSGVVALSTNQSRLFVGGEHTMVNAISEFVHDSSASAGLVQVHVTANINWTTATTTERAAGVAVADDLRMRMRAPIEARGAKSDGTSITFEGRDNSNNVTSQVFDDGQVQVGGASGPKRLYGSGAPASTPADGSTYQRTDSAGGQVNHYTRQNGAWVPTGKPPRVLVGAGGIMPIGSAANGTANSLGTLGVVKLGDAGTEACDILVPLVAWAPGYQVNLWYCSDAAGAASTYTLNTFCDLLVSGSALTATRISANNQPVNETTAAVPTSVRVDNSTPFVPTSDGPYHLRIARTVSDPATTSCDIIAIEFEPQ